MFLRPQCLGRGLLDYKLQLAKTGFNAEINVVLQQTTPLLIRVSSSHSRKTVFKIHAPTCIQQTAMASYLVTGSSRGLGLALVSRLASLPKTEVAHIIATARQDNSPQLKEIVSASSGRVEFVKLDVTNKASVGEAIKSVEQKLQGKGLDYLINNAGVMDSGNDGLAGM